MHLAISGAYPYSRKVWGIAYHNALQQSNSTGEHVASQHTLELPGRGGGGVDSLSMGVSMGVGEEQVPRMCLISKAIVVGIRGYWVETLFYSYYY